MPNIHFGGKLKIKKILTAILAITILATPACGSDEDSKTLTVYSGRSEKLVGPIFSDFEATTGINLEIKYGSSNDLALAISTESNTEIGFNSNFNKVSIFYKNKNEEIIPKMRKSNIAEEIVNRIISELN